MKKLFPLFFSIAFFGIMTLVLWTSSGRAQAPEGVGPPDGVGRGPIAQCRADLDACRTALGTCPDELNICNTNLGVCDGALTSCTGDLGTCNTDHGVCTADLDTCNTNLNTCNNDLTDALGNLDSCNDDLAACQAQAQAAAPVPQTGQTTSWAVGDDGEIQAGVAWPNPRFSANIDLNGDGDCTDVDETCDGTVTDILTGLVWLKDANCLGKTVVWEEALDFSNGLYDGCPDCGGTNNDCGLSDNSVVGDWYLANRNQLTSLLDLGTSFPALPIGHPFMNFQPSTYWSSTSDAGAGLRWVVDFESAAVLSPVDSPAALQNFVLPVRGGS